MTLIHGCHITFEQDVRRGKQAMEQAQKRVRETIDRIIYDMRQNSPEVGSD